MHIRFEHNEKIQALGIINSKEVTLRLFNPNFRILIKIK